VVAVATEVPNDCSMTGAGPDCAWHGMDPRPNNIAKASATPRKDVAPEMNSA
jgi:hypothetical protein